MQITPLYRHAALRLPVLTSLFSDALAVASISVVKDGVTTITTTAAHGVTTGDGIAIAITDAPFPNPIETATKLANGDWALTTAYDHDLTTTPNVNVGEAWDVTTKLAGFDAAAMNGTIQLVSVTDRTTFTVRPSTTVSAITLAGDEVQLRSLEQEIVGWHKVTAATSTTLTFPTPDTVLRNYVVSDALVTRNIRVFGAVNIDTVMEKYVVGDAASTLSNITMFITPRDQVQIRPRARGGITSMSPSDAVHFRVEDGFHVIVLVPAQVSAAGVSALDLAHGDILRAVVRTFNGLSLPRADWPMGNPYPAVLERHGPISHNGATYVHEYVFGAPADITNDDRIQPWEIADIAAAPIGSTSVHRVGAPAFRGVTFTGLTHSVEPGILEASIELDDQA